jgi:hypothetical protein
MATTHSFELAAWFKAINDHELAYKSNEEITSELPLQIQTANRVRPNSLKTPSACCKICQKNTHWTYECPNQKNERKPASDTSFSKYRNNASPFHRGPMNIPRNTLRDKNGHLQGYYLLGIADLAIGHGSLIRLQQLQNEINYICKDIEANMFANTFNFNTEVILYNF